MNLEPILNSETRLSLLGLPEWVKLLRHFELGDGAGFTLIVLLAGDSSVARLCQKELDLWLCARQRPRVLRLPLETPEDLANLPEELLRMTPPTGPIWVDGSGARELYEQAWIRCALKLNRTRDAVAHRFSTPLILVGAPWIREILRDTAPDLWSVRAFVAEITGPRPAGVLAQQQAAPGIEPSEFTLDVELTLGETAALRGRPGRERQLSKLLNRAGDELMRRGRSQEALTVLREAVALDETAVSQEPDRADYLRKLSVSYSSIGDLMRSFGAGDEAREFYRKDLDIAERLVRQGPDRTDYLRDLSVSYSKMGDLMRSLGAGDEARQLYQKSLDIAERLVRQEPDRADYLRDLSVSYSKMGDLMTSLGAGDETRQFYQKSLEIFERLVRWEPDRADYLRDLSVSYSKMGNLMSSLGASDEARQFYRKDLDIAERLARQEPDRTDYLHDLSVSYCRMGNLMSSLGASDEAHEFYRKSIEITERLVRQEPDRADYLANLVSSLARIGDTDASQKARLTLQQIAEKRMLADEGSALLPKLEEPSNDDPLVS